MKIPRLKSKTKNIVVAFCPSNIIYKTNHVSCHPDIPMYYSNPCRYLRLSTPRCIECSLLDLEEGVMVIGNEVAV